MTQAEKQPRTLTGRVVSNKMQDTIVVEIERLERHAAYGKYLRRTTKLHAHAQGNPCAINDVVVIKACRPISKMKSWMLHEIVKKAEQA